jgi:hypothetical protein
LFIKGGWKISIFIMSFSDEASLEALHGAFIKVNFGNERRPKILH